MMPEGLWGTLPSLQTLPATLLHSLWQGALLTVLVFVSLRCIPVNRPNLRYGVAVAGLLGIVFAALITWCVLGYTNLNSEAPPIVTSAVVVQGSAVASVSGVQGTPTPTRDAQTPPSPPSSSGFLKPSASDYLLWVWFAGFLVMTLRVLRLMKGARHLRRHCRPLEDFRMGVVFEEIKEALKLSRHISLLVSDAITSPLAMGLFWPAVVLPATLVTGLSSGQLRAILAHELAHIRRYDYLINFIQLIVEAIFYYNPAAWWLSRQIRIEREACCDALAVRIVGENIDYAEILLHLAQTARQAPLLAAAAQGFSLQEKHQGRLLDRVRRLLLPGYWPQLRLRWYSVALGLLITIALLLGLFQSSRLSVTFAGWFMSDKERISVMTELNREYGPSEGYRKEGSTVEVTGEIITADGKPLPEDSGYLHCVVITRNCISSEGFSQEGTRFHGKVSQGALFILAAFPGYAPKCIGPLQGNTDTPIRDIKIQIEPCKNAIVHFTDSKGVPISDVKVSRSYYFEKGGSRSGIGCLSRTSDKDGNVAIEQATPPIPMSLNVSPKGFIPLQRDDVLVKDGETFNWVLSTENPLEGVVVDRQTGNPIAGADIAVFYESDGHFMGNGDGEVVSTTDLNGHFSIHGLAQGTIYYLLVHAKGHGKEAFNTINRGKEALTVKLGGPRYVRGEIRGNLSLLKQKDNNEGPFITSVMPLEVSSNDRTTICLTDSMSTPVTIKDGVGSFQIDGLRAGTLEIQAGPKHLNVPVNEPVENLVINLDDVARKRKLVINLPSSEGAPAANGTIKVRRVEVGSERYPDEESINVVNGYAETEIVVPAQIYLGMEKLAGFMPQSEDTWKKWMVSEGSEPYVIDLPLMRAGAIQGQVFRADGTPAAFAHVYVLEQSEDKSSRPAKQENLDCNENGEFAVQPLPLGSTFKVKASIGFAQSEQYVSLSTWKPLDRVTLRLPAGIDISVRVVNPEGQPVPNCKIEVNWPGNTHELHADPMGQYKLEQVNPNLQYTVSAYPQDYFQSATIDLSLDASKNIIHVQKGLILEGTLRMAGTNAPIPDHDIRVNDYVNPETKKFTHFNIRTTSNSEGKFRFTNLPSEKMILRPDGTKELTPDGTDDACTFTPGQKEPITLYMVPNTTSTK